LLEGIPPNVTIGISPILCEQIEHPDFKEIFVKYCKEKIEAARQDEIEFTNRHYDLHHIYLTRYWQEWYTARLEDFTGKYNRSIIGAFKTLQDNAAIEVMTCGATHGYLPLLGSENSVDLQFKVAVENYKKHFGRNPRGIWLPECAYRPGYFWKSLIPIYPYNVPHLRPGIEHYIAKHNIEYFVTDQSLLERSQALGVFLDSDKERFQSVHSPNFTPGPWNFDKSPMDLYHVCSSEQTGYGTAVAFTRHHDISMQVWSGEIGYPGEPDYLDFHKKHLGSMIRYWRVTDNKADMMYKTLYHPDWTQNKIDQQSNHFIHHIENSVNWYNKETGKFGTLCTPFDTELFGHWWFEGPEFIKAVARGLHNSPYVDMTTASEEILVSKPREVISLPEGSWGKNNNHDVWSNNETKWTWEAIYNDENRLNAILEKYPLQSCDDNYKEILTQALRELMLLQSSDWQFLIYTQSARDYAEQRFSYHHSDFNKLCDLAEKYVTKGTMDEVDFNYLHETSARNCPFQELKIDWW
jgi:1,4-alpha-glucan branching enzyme